MAEERVLVSWIGHADLRAMSVDLTADKRKEVLRVVGDGSQQADAPGPIRTLTEAECFDRVFLLSNYPPPIGRLFRDRLGAAVQLRQVKLDNPTDYRQIFQIADEQLASIVSARENRSSELCIHLSPGTPAMAAIWVLLGKSKYPATFYQTHRGKAWKTEIPFDLALDYVPELLRQPDAHLQHLAAESPQQVRGFEDIVGDSQPIRLAVGRAKRAAMRDVSVLLMGESGTGKEMFARAIHNAGHRRDKPFVAVNCAAISRELLESELFGHKKGAFTGATEDRVGAFEAADGGTLFLDEIGEFDVGMQTKLLRVLQQSPGDAPCVRAFQRVGETKERRSDVRVVAATNRNLAEAVATGQFREDLLYRLAVITIKLPPLRERSTDVLGIAASMLEQVNRQFAAQEPGYKDKYIGDSAKIFVLRHSWPGNVRELYNALLQAAVMSEGEELRQEDLRAAIVEIPSRQEVNLLETPLGHGFNLEEYLQNIQRHYLRRAMSEAHGIKTRAAKLLGMSNYQTLDAQLKRLGVRLE
jgi:transcriptional regulator with PAS, ATPase and Fis domain